MHLCSTKNGSSGGPILNLTNLKIIGIHTGTMNLSYNYNIGLFLNEPIKKFIQKKNGDNIILNIKTESDLYVKQLESKKMKQISYNVSSLRRIKKEFIDINKNPPDNIVGVGPINIMIFLIGKQ